MDIRNYIQRTIKPNDAEEITGAVLRQVLLQMCDALGLSSSSQVGNVILYNGQPLSTSGQAENLAATRAFAGNPAITGIAYRFDGPNGIGNGFIEQNIYRHTTPTTGYQCYQVLRLNYRRFYRYIQLASAPSSDGIFDVTSVGAWTQIQ